METKIPLPHGGKLVNRNASKIDTSDFHTVEVSNDLRNDIENIADGVFSPLEGFVGREDFESILSSGRLKDGTPWTVPILLDVNQEESIKIRDAGKVLLTSNGEEFAVLDVDEAYTYDKKNYARLIYGTNDDSHPGVMKVNGMKEWLIAGKVNLFANEQGNNLREFRMTPTQTRSELRDRNWKTMVGFQTRNVPHVAHEMLQKAALNVFDGVFLNPLIGKKKKGDFKDEVILTSYKALIENYYPANRVIFSTLHTEMRYAGPKEAIHHAIMRKNFGCSHFIVGRDHAGVGSFYHPFAAHKIFADYPDLGIEPLFFPAFYYCKKCMAFSNERICAHGEEFREELSGTKMRNMVSSGEIPPKHLMRPEVASAITSFKDPFV